MALTAIQKDVMRCIASNRSESSYVAGGVVLNRDWPRQSDDIDIFHDREERLATAIVVDEQSLRNAGYKVEWRLRSQTFYRAIVEREGAMTRLEWAVDSDFRFLPTQAEPDPDQPEALHGLVVHHGSRKGAWPSSPEIGSVMLRERP